MNSRTKGKRGELEIVRILRDYGYSARRGQQFSGANGDPDVVGLPGVHIEVKRRDRLEIHDAMDQAKRDARNGEIPSVWHRKNNCEWLVTVKLDDFMSLYREYAAGLSEEWKDDTERQIETLPEDT